MTTDGHRAARAWAIAQHLAGQKTRHSIFEGADHRAVCFLDKRGAFALLDLARRTLHKPEIREGCDRFGRERKEVCSHGWSVTEGLSEIRKEMRGKERGAPP